MENIENRLLNPIFICGHYRSGTSLLNHLFDGHKAVLALPIETKFFTYFLPALQAKKRVHDALEGSLMRHFYPVKSDDFKRFYGSIDSEAFRTGMEDRLKSIDNTKASLFLEAYVHTCLQFLDHKATVKYWVEKTPMNEVFMEEIRSFWPSAKFIHVYRDPRDMHHTIRSRSDFDLEPRTTAHNWRRSVDLMNKHVQELGSEAIYSLSYEELTANPEGIMRGIAEFLKIPFSEVLLKPTTGLNTVSWEGNAQGGSFTGISTKSVGKWRESPFDDEMKMIEYLCRDRMEELGYKLELNQSPLDHLKGMNQEIIILLKRFRALLFSQKRSTY